MKMTSSFLMKKLKPKKIKSRRNKRKRRVKAKIKVKIKNRKKKARNSQKKKEVKIKSKINKSSKNSSFYEVVLQLFKSIIMMFLFLRIAICAWNIIIVFNFNCKQCDRKLLQSSLRLFSSAEKINRLSK